MTAQVEEKQLITKAAELAFSTAEETAQIAEQGNVMLKKSVVASDSVRSQVNTANDLMAKLIEQSTSIGAIVSTIRSIAEQTNLLALNAAMEANTADTFSMPGDVSDLFLPGKIQLTDLLLLMAPNSRIFFSLFSVPE